MNEKVFRTVWIFYHLTDLIIHYLTPKFQLNQSISLIVINLNFKLKIVVKQL
jgi:hypothetical protein